MLETSVTKVRLLPVVFVLLLAFNSSVFALTNQVDAGDPIVAHIPELNGRPLPLPVPPPSSPTSATSHNVELISTVDGIFWDVAVQPPFACAAGIGAAAFYDLSDPRMPRATGSWFADSERVAIAESYAYITGLGRGDIIDLLDPPDFSFPVDFPFADDGPVYSGPELDGGAIDVSGSYAYVAEGTSFRVVKVSDPRHPVTVGQYTAPSDLFDIDVQGPVAYGAGLGALHIIDVGNPSEPGLCRSLGVPGFAEGVCASGSYAYVASHWEEETPIAPLGEVPPGNGFPTFPAPRGRLTVVDISDPANPSEKGHYDIPGAQDVSISGSLAYVVYSYIGLAPMGSNEGMRIINISRPENPAEVGYYERPLVSICGTRIGASGEYAYLAGGDGLLVLRYTGPRPENSPPNPPALIGPPDGAVASLTPCLSLSSSDADGDRLTFRIELLQDGVIVAAFDQTQDADGWDMEDYASAETAMFTLSEGQALAEGSYRWRAYAFDGTQWSAAGQIWSFAVVGGPPSLCGCVIDTAGRAVEGAYVEVLWGSERRAVQTDDTGEYAFYGLEPGVYDIRVSAVNRPARAELVEVLAGGTNRQDDICLYDEPPPLVTDYAPVLYFYPGEEGILEVLDPGEKYRPMPVELFLDHATIAGESARRSIAQDPTRGDHMDLAGTESNDYEQLFQQHQGHYHGYDADKPMVYARVYRDSYYCVVQYWFHYLYNPTPPLPFSLWPSHEGDWEMMQLLWTTDSPANDEPPAYATCSRHLNNLPSDPETRVWDQVEVNASTHPRVYVALASHASYFDNGMHARDYTGADGPFATTPVLFPHTDNTDLNPHVTENWAQFAGRWGANQDDSPIGPAHKEGTQWAEPVDWCAKGIKWMMMKKMLANWTLGLPHDIKGAPDYDSGIRYFWFSSGMADLGVALDWLVCQKSPMTVRLELYHKLGLGDWGEPELSTEGMSPPMSITKQAAGLGFWGYRIMAANVPGEGAAHPDAYPCVLGVHLGISQDARPVVDGEFGGTVRLSDGTTTTIAPGALPAAALIVVSSAPADAVSASVISAANAASPNPVLADTIRNIGGRSVESEDAITRLDADVTIAIPYSDADDDGMVDGTRISETSLRMFQLDEGARVWQLIPNSRVNPDENTIEAEVRQFGIVCLMALPSSAVAS